MINQDRLLKTFMDLVRIDSPSGQEEAMAQEVTGRLRSLGFVVRRDAYGNVIARHGSSESARILLSAHLDTVEPGCGIKPRIEGGRVVSDGTTILGGDSKAGMAGIFEALTSAQENGAINLPIEVAFSRQEEVGLLGARNMDFSLITAPEAVVFDTEGPVSRIISGAPTYVSINGDIVGRAAHAGAEPQKGISAIRMATDFISRLPQGRLDDVTTFNIGTIHGGSGRNTVPELVTLQGEFRTLDEETVHRLTSEVEKAISEVKALYPEGFVNLKLEREVDGYRVTGEEPLLVRIKKILHSMELEPELVTTGGITDGNIMRQHGITALVVGMAVRDLHTVRESVDISWLLDTTRLCERLIEF